MISIQTQLILKIQLTFNHFKKKKNHNLKNFTKIKIIIIIVKVIIIVIINIILIVIFNIIIIIVKIIIIIIIVILKLIITIIEIYKL